jgi:hypothetical protein
VEGAAPGSDLGSHLPSFRTWGIRDGFHAKGQDKSVQPFFLVFAVVELSVSPNIFVRLAIAADTPDLTKELG